LHDQTLAIFGDGEQTRDFVNVRGVAQANYRAGMNRGASGAFNIASGSRVTINRLVEILGAAAGLAPRVEHGPARKGDVLHSLADISAAGNAFGYHPTVGLEEGLKEYMDWAKQDKV